MIYNPKIKVEKIKKKYLLDNKHKNMQLKFKSMKHNLMI